MEVEQSRATGWVGWVLFAGIVLVLLGAAHACVGTLAIFEPDILRGTRPALLLGLPLTVLAWGHLLLGLGAVITGVGLIRGLAWARFVAIVIALFTALISFVFALIYPIWAGVIIVFCGIVLYATAAHGDEVADAYGQ
jgi:hypothetical protein